MPGRFLFAMISLKYGITYCQYLIADTKITGGKKIRIAGVAPTLSADLDFLL
jgi:hypothetical protein